jgi:hypothetical protein
MSQVDEAQAESVGHSAVFAAEVAKFSRGIAGGVYSEVAVNIGYR